MTPFRRPLVGLFFRQPFADFMMSPIVGNLPLCKNRWIKAEKSFGAAWRKGWQIEAAPRCHNELSFIKLLVRYQTTECRANCSRSEKVSCFTGMQIFCVTPATMFAYKFVSHFFLSCYHSRTLHHLRCIVELNYAKYYCSLWQCCRSEVYVYFFVILLQPEKPARRWPLWWN